MSHKRTRRLVVSCGALLCMLAGQAMGQALAEDDFRTLMDRRQAAWDELQQAGNLNAQTVTELNREVLASVDLASLSISQIRDLNAVYGFFGMQNLEPMVRRLRDAAKSPTLEGAQAAVIAQQFAQQTRTAAEGESPLDLLRHPGRDALLATEDGGMLMQMVSMALRAGDADAKREVYAFIGSLPDGVHRNGVMAIRGVIGQLARTHTEEIADMHARAVARATELTRAAIAAADDPALEEHLGDVLSFYEGAYAQGKLIGSAMPRLDVIWHSNESISSMDAYRGKVVVLDFWATWCGPCIASFPNVRELQEHYEGYDVAIVGVTSVQGTHYGSQGPVDCEGDPEREFALMREFMGERGMTWDVAFTRQEVFNPHFGVQGIPHVAIVDPAGRVRYNGLHPAGPMVEKTSKIDELLREAGLRTPGG